MDVVELDRRAHDVTAAMVDATPADRYEAPTPCGTWTVGELIAHLVAGDVKYLAIARGADWSRGAPAVDVGDDPAGMYRRTGRELFDAWSQPGVLDRELTLPSGRGRAESALFIHLGEALVHGWDLAKATGQEPAFDSDIVEACLSEYQSWLPTRRPAGSPFADANDVGDDASTIDRLAAFLGRDVEAWRQP